jgi:hypothetical protein
MQLESDRSPYQKNNIEFTRKAFQLDQIKEKTYPALGDLTPDDISKNQETIDNIRIWDWRLILQIYRQTQEIRLYYEFYQVDVDRYHLEDGYHQVMLSARELAAQLPPKVRTWVNESLQFTQGISIPQLKRIIVIHGNKETLSDMLRTKMGRASGERGLVGRMRLAHASDHPSAVFDLVLFIHKDDHEFIQTSAELRPGAAQD